jgi:hypothetical protein
MASRAGRQPSPTTEPQSVERRGRASDGGPNRPPYQPPRQGCPRANRATQWRTPADTEVPRPPERWNADAMWCPRGTWAPRCGSRPTGGRPRGGGARCARLRGHGRNVARWSDTHDRPPVLDRLGHHRLPDCGRAVPHHQRERGRGPASSSAEHPGSEARGARRRRPIARGAQRAGKRGFSRDLFRHLEEAPAEKTALEEMHAAGEFRGALGMRDYVRLSTEVNDRIVQPSRDGREPAPQKPVQRPLGAWSRCTRRVRAPPRRRVPACPAVRVPDGGRVEPADRRAVGGSE